MVKVNNLFALIALFKYTKAVKPILLSFLGLSLLASSYLIGWNKGWGKGYDCGIADVFFNLVDPDTYFMRYIHVPSHQNH